MINKILLSVLLAVCLVKSSLAQPMMPDLGFKTGILRGFLYEKIEGQKKAVADQSVAIMVFQNGQRVLMLDKKSDEKGYFEFKNIFRDMAFKYTLGAMNKDHLYLINDLQMKEDQESLFVEFEIGLQSKNLVPDSVVAQIQQEAGNGSSEATAGGVPDGSMSMGNETVSKTANQVLLGPSKKVALVLSGLVLVYAFYFALRKQDGI